MGRERQTYVAFDKFGEVNIPYFEGNREIEEFDASLINLEALFEVFIIF